MPDEILNNEKLEISFIRKKDSTDDYYLKDTTARSSIKNIESSIENIEKCLKGEETNTELVLHTHGNKGILDDIDDASITNWDNAATNSHTHTNTSALDSIDSTKITNWDAAATKAHSHTNTSALDSIDSTKITNWNNAETKAHTHENIADLNGINATRIAKWDGKLEEIADGSIGTAKIANGSITEDKLSQALKTEIDKIANIPSDDKIKGFVNTGIASVIDDAPDAFDTLKEIAEWIGTDTTGAAEMATDISAVKDKLEGINDTVKDYTDSSINKLSEDVFNGLVINQTVGGVSSSYDMTNKTIVDLLRDMLCKANNGSWTDNISISGAPSLEAKEVGTEVTINPLSTTLKNKVTTNYDFWVGDIKCSKAYALVPPTSSDDITWTRTIEADSDSEDILTTDGNLKSGTVTVTDGEISTSVNYTFKAEYDYLNLCGSDGKPKLIDVSDKIEGNSVEEVYIRVTKDTPTNCTGSGTWDINYTDVFVGTDIGSKGTTQLQDTVFSKTKTTGTLVPMRKDFYGLSDKRFTIDSDDNSVNNITNNHTIRTSGTQMTAGNNIIISGVNSKFIYLVLNKKPKTLSIEMYDTMVGYKTYSSFERSEKPIIPIGGVDSNDQTLGNYSKDYYLIYIRNDEQILDDEESSKFSKAQFRINYTY